MKKLVIHPDTSFFLIWKVLFGLACIVTAFLYPYCTAYGFSNDLGTPQMTFLLSGEFISSLNIFFSFFLAYKDEGSDVYETDPKKIRARYIKNELVWDLFILIPWGLLSYIGRSFQFLEILWVIKSIRIEKLFSTLDRKSVNPVLRYLQWQKT